MHKVFIKAVTVCLFLRFEHQRGESVGSHELICTVVEYTLFKCKSRVNIADDLTSIHQLTLNQGNLFILVDGFFDCR